MVAVVAALGLVAGCSRGEPDQEARSGFTVDDRQLVVPRTPITGHPDPDRWDVQVAWVDPDVPQVLVLKDLPAALRNRRSESTTAADTSDRRAKSDATVAAEAPGPDLTLSATPPPGAEALTPIPSPGLSWGSSEIEGNWLFQNPTRIGSPLVFLVVADHGDWLQVQFPARPNHQTGWISKNQVTLRTHRWHAEVNATTNRLRVWEGDELKVDTAVVAGTQYTPTPLGRFYINEMQKTDSWSAYGSWILSTNGFSDTLERFGGEVPIFALHGTPYAETVGQDLSNGCIRMPNDVVEYLAENMPVGTPVDVVA